MKWLMVAVALLVSPAIAADAPGRQPPPGEWSIQAGEADTLHGVWVVNSSTGKVYRCVQYAAQASCVEATMFTAEEWARRSQQPPSR